MRSTEKLGEQDVLLAPPITLLGQQVLPLLPLLSHAYALCRQLWERGGKRTSLEFSLEWSETLWWRHFWWQTVSVMLARCWCITRPSALTF